MVEYEFSDSGGVGGGGGGGGGVGGGGMGGMAVVGDADHRASGRQPGQRGVELGGGVRVQVGGGLVQQEQRGVTQERAGERELLALAGGQWQPALPQRRSRNRAAGPR